MTNHADTGMRHRAAAAELPDAPMAMPEQQLERRAAPHALRVLLMPWTVLSWARAR